jgi:nucleosome binding factor SPN SPT16 subunit
MCDLLSGDCFRFATLRWFIKMDTNASILWQEGSNWSGATALLVVAGAAAEDIRYWKSTSLHLWLLSYEFTGELD